MNHGGDSDSTGAIAGNLLGAELGEAAIPAEWVEDLEGLQIVLRTADELDRCAGVAGENPPDVAPLD